MDPRAANLCPGCGATFPDIPGGETHRYMESSPGCWAAYGEVLAREYSSPALFQRHKFTVDAYAVQHPGRPSPQSIQSVGVHLIRLCLMLEGGATAAQATATMQSAARRKELFRWLEPPPSPGAVTVANVHRAASPEEHGARVASKQSVGTAPPMNPYRLFTMPLARRGSSRSGARS